MTYGSPSTLADIPAYLSSIRRGREAPPELVADFRARYERIGLSPLVRITAAQAQAVQQVLDTAHGPGAFRVEVGMLHSAPRIAEAVERLATAGVQRIVGVALAPQYSPIILAGYERELEACRGALGPDTIVSMAGAWGDDPALIRALAARTREALGARPLGAPGDTRRVVMTAHSLPRSVVDRDPGYLDQLSHTAKLVADAAGLPDGTWEFAYQSAGHTAEEWLKPDVKDLIPGMRAAGVQEIIVVPVQFVADHLETLYDIDVVAVEEAAEAGILMRRIPAPNVSDDFIAALRTVIERETGAFLSV